MNNRESNKVRDVIQSTTWDLTNVAVHFKTWRVTVEATYVTPVHIIDNVTHAATVEFVK
jgi:hypothetical protein